MNNEDLPPDIHKALQRLQGYMQQSHPDIAPYFDLSNAMAVGRAPGRLDVMGGIADYSGSTVLQLPIAESAVVFCQLSDAQSPEIRVGSIDAQGSDSIRCFSAPVSAIYQCSDADSCSYDVVRAYFGSLPSHQRWAAYVAGVLPVLLNEYGVRCKQSLSILLCSTVPEGKGVSSSAAIEVATMRAVTKSLDISIDAHRQALLCQQVENHIVGAPCGLMDQMTSSVGDQGKLLNMLCQPDVVKSAVSMPDTLAVWGIDSGLRHHVSGADYGSVRVAAFIGYRMMLDFAGVADPTVPAQDIDDQKWGGYLANVSVSEFEATFADELPLSMCGAEFLDKYCDTGDTVTQVDPTAEYAVRNCTAHPVYEHFRARVFARLLAAEARVPSSAEVAVELGECMLQSHASYGRCGLGSPGTDELVKRLCAAGPANGVFGARITGGGSGGTVAVLTDANAEELIHEIAESYAASVGIGGHVFSGSSAGAAAYQIAPQAWR